MKKMSMIYNIWNFKKSLHNMSERKWVNLNREKKKKEREKKWKKKKPKRAQEYVELYQKI